MNFGRYDNILGNSKLDSDMSFLFDISEIIDFFMYALFARVKHKFRFQKSFI